MSFFPSRLLAVLLACGLQALAPVTTHASQLITNLQLGRPQKVVAYGTSLTEGGQWVADTANWLGTQYPGLVTVINSGLSGKASNTALANLQTKVIAHAPDTVIIEFAMNDAFTAYATTDPDYGITVAKSQANLNQMIDTILAARPTTEIVLQTMNPPWDAPNGNQSASKRPNLAAYYEGYRQVAAARGLLLVDHYVNWVQLRTTDLAKFQAYLPDGVHPTAVGSTAITFPGLQKALSMTPTRSAPTGLTATSGDTQVTLAWNGVLGATGYTVKRATSNGGSYTVIASGLTSLAYTDTGRTNGVTYRYVVSATDSGGESPDSVPAIATALVQVVIIKDNADATGATFTGSWTASALAGCYGTNSFYASANSGATARFTPSITVPGHYAVHARWTASSNRATNAAFNITDINGPVTVTQNQQLNHGLWVQLGIFQFAAGTSGNVTLGTTGANGLVIADAVRFTLIPATTVAVTATAATAEESGAVAGVFTVTRQGPSYLAPLTVPCTLGGTAVNGVDFTGAPASVTIPAGTDTASVAINPVADALSEGDESVTLTLSAGAAYDLTASATAWITLKDRPVDSWRFARFTAAQRANPAISGDLADPDGDGCSNLLEYALGRDPLAADGAGLPATVLDDHLTLTFPRRQSATDLSYIPEVSSTLASGWSSGPAVVEQTLVADQGNGFSLVRARDLTALGASTHRFLRLRVSMQ